MPNSSSSTKSKSNIIKGSVFEQLKDLGSQTIKSTVSEAGKIGSGVFSQMLKGPQTYSEAGQNRLLPPERFPRRPEQLIKPKAPEIQIFNFREREEHLEVSREIKAVLLEIKKEIFLLEKKQKMIIAEASKLTVAEIPEKPGIYHVRFFEWILSILRDLHKKISESATWLSALNTKKKRMGYWGMFKKHGTKFGLSGERTVATQSG